MSKTKKASLKIGFIQEGVTDLLVLECLIKKLLSPRTIISSYIQEPFSRALQTKNTNTVGGWSGVYKCITENKKCGNGKFRGSPLLKQFDLLIIQIDVDVASKTYESARLTKEKHHVDLPSQENHCTLKNQRKDQCIGNCTVHSHAADSLRNVVLSWMNEDDVPPMVVFCTPSRNTEAWVYTALFPDDPLVVSGKIECIERLDTDMRIKPLESRIRKNRKDYSRKVCPAIENNLNHVLKICSEAKRFSQDLKNAVREK